MSRRLTRGRELLRDHGMTDTLEAVDIETRHAVDVAHAIRDGRGVTDDEYNRLKVTVDRLTTAERMNHDRH